MKNIAIIPARGGSKRVKNKNIIDFHGKPMIFYILKSLADSKVFEKIHVSTDSVEIKKVVEALGYEVEFMRPNSLADDYTGIVPVLQWVLSEYNLKGLNFDNICCALPTAPLITSEDFKKSYERYMKLKCKFPLHAVSKMPVPIEWTYRVNREGILIPIMPEMLKKRSQDLDEAYYDAGAFSWFPINYFTSSMSQDQPFISYLLERDRSVDIDNLDDFELAKKLYKTITFE